MTLLYLPKKYTKLDHMKRVETQGKHVGRTSGSYVLDLVDLKKTVVLCDLCRRKFNARAYRYVQHYTIPRVQGQCDACKRIGINDMYVHESFNY